MPLDTEILRDGERLQLPWGHFHVTAMLYAIAFERELTSPNDDIDYPKDPQGLSPANIFAVTDYQMIAHVCPDGNYTLKGHHHFVDITDGTTLQLRPGDRLSFRRSYK